MRGSAPVRCWRPCTAGARPGPATRRGIDVPKEWMRASSGLPALLHLPALVLEPELLAQQPAGIIGNAPQPGFIGEAALALFGGLGGLGGGFTLFCRWLRGVLQGLPHLFALRRVGRRLGFGGGGGGVAVAFRRFVGAVVVGPAFGRGRRVVRVAVPARARRLACTGRTLAVTRLLAVVVPVLLAGLGALWGGLPVHRRLDRALVGDGVLHAGILAKRLLVGLDRLRVMAGLGECVATVVIRVRTLDLGVTLGRIVEVAVPVRLGGLLHLLVGTLVGPLPEVAGRHPSWPPQHQHEHEHHSRRAAAEREQRQQHQRRQQPEPAVLPAASALPGLVGTV